MDEQWLLKPFEKPISWVLLALTVGLIGIYTLYPIPEPQKIGLIVLTLFMGGIGLAAVRFLLPRIEPNNWVIYGGIIFHCLGIAASEYLIGSPDLSALYFIRIIASTLMWNQRAALFTALLSSALQPSTFILTGGDPLVNLPRYLLQGGVYFLTAILLSQFGTALTERWRASAEVAGQQHHEITKRKDELELLYELAQLFGDTRDERTVLRQMTERIAHALNSEMCMIAQMDPVALKVRGLPPGFGVSEADILEFSYDIRAEHLKTWDMSVSQFLIARHIDQLPGELGEFARRHHASQIIAARMTNQGIPTGYIVVSNRTDNLPYTEADARLLSILAEQAAIAVENLRLYEELQTNLQNAARLYAISTELLSRLDPDTLPRRVVAIVAEALHAPVSSIALWNEDTGQLEIKAQLGIPAEAIKMPFRKDGLGMGVLTRADC